MHRYIGIDAHSESCTVAVMGPSGKRLKEARLERIAGAVLAMWKNQEEYDPARQQ